MKQTSWVKDIDSTPTSGSTNLIESGAVYDALDGKQNTLTSPMAYLGSNITGGTANDTGAFWAAQGTGYAYFDQDGQLNGQPNRWGFLVSWVNGNQIYQEYHLYPDGNQYKRGSNGSGAMPEWTQMATQAAVDGKVSKSGDTMTNDLTIKRSNNAAIRLLKSGATDDFTVKLSAATDGNGNNRAILQQRVDGSAGAEGYYLPVPDAHDAFTGYSILTNKNPVTIAQGGTGATDSPTARYNFNVIETWALAQPAYDSTHAAITAGEYVYVRRHPTLSEDMYVATTNIAANGALSTSNLSKVNGGALNDLRNKINTLTSETTISYGSSSYVKYYKRGNIVHVSARFSLSDTSTVAAWGTSQTLATLPVGFRPTTDIQMRGIVDRPDDEGACVAVKTNGTVTIVTRYNAFSTSGDAIQACLVYATAY